MIPQTMFAAILAESRKPLIVDEVILPGSLEPGQVAVRVLYSGICGSQLGEIAANKGEDKFLPHLLGHEASGEVMECGPGVRHAVPGDLVVLHWRQGRGIESVPPAYSWRGKKLNAGRIATFNQYAIVSENRLTVVPADSPRELLPLFGCAITTGLGVVVNNAKLKLGESVIVYGAGGVGLNIIQGASLVGAHPIIAVDRFDNRLGLAKQFGATHTINGHSTNVEKAIQEILSACGQLDGADVCIDNTGCSEVIGSLYRLVHSRGRVVCVGVPALGDETRLHTLPLHFGKSITGSHGGEAVPQDDIPRYLRLMREGKLRLDGLVTEVFPLKEINTAIDRMRSGEMAGRCLLDCR